jgi:hypothetical protein
LADPPFLQGPNQMADFFDFSPLFHGYSYNVSDKIYHNNRPASVIPAQHNQLSRIPPR